MPLEEVFILILGRRILLMICESEDRLTGRAIIVVARTTDYCFYADTSVCSFSADNDGIIQSLHEKGKGE